jgi:AraC-like DNA-binding protein
LAECLADECRTPDQFNRLYLDALTVAVCIDFLRLSAEPPGRRTGRLAASQVRSATDYVMEHLSEPVRLAALADLTGLSQWHFARAFKAATGLSPHQWQLNARIAKAQELLLSRSMPHAQIALEVGSAEQSHLCRVFKNMTGVSPAAWLRDRWTPRRAVFDELDLAGDLRIAHGSDALRSTPLPATYQNRHVLLDGAEKMDAGGVDKHIDPAEVRLRIVTAQLVLSTKNETAIVVFTESL